MRKIPIKILVKYAIVGVAIVTAIANVIMGGSVTEAIAKVIGSLLGAI